MAYEGWSNYPTWAMNLWLANDEGLYHMVRDAARECVDLDGPESTLARLIEEWATDNAPDLGGTLWSDLLQSALSDVDFYEVAESWIADAREEAA